MEDKPVFSSHNVLLPDGTQTALGLPFVRESAVCRAAVRELERKFGTGSHEGITIADLGSLEGGYAVEFAQHGYDVTGVEARAENYEGATWLQETLAWPNLHFIQGDVREVLADRQFDVVFCSGLLYHLDKPVFFLKQIGAATRKMLILNTHYSLEGGHPENVHHPDSRCEYGDFEHEGRKGHWYYEEDSRWASFVNRSSFWLRKEDLVLSLREDAGFNRVTEIEDWQDREDWVSVHIPGGAGFFRDRGMFVAFKS
jgi:SAM-dependent methyltransferase